jgi:hypothetical protein
MTVYRTALYRTERGSAGFYRQVGIDNSWRYRVTKLILASGATTLGSVLHASAADLFVTQEQTKSGKLAYILDQLPIQGFEVINLKQFLTRI